MKAHFRTLPGFVTPRPTKQPPELSVAAICRGEHGSLLAGAQSCPNEHELKRKREAQDAGWDAMAARLRQKYRRTE